MRHQMFLCDRCTGEIGAIAPRSITRLEKLSLQRGDVKQPQDLCTHCQDNLDRWWAAWKGERV